MAPWTFYQLHPKPGAGFHFGQRGLEQESSGEHCPSDTLFAALVATLAGLEGNAGVTAFTAPFEAGQPPFLLTSLFPRAGDIPLLPLPRRRLNLTPQRGQRKLLKRLRYVSPQVFGAILAGENMDTYATPQGQGRFLQSGQVWLSAEEQRALPEAWRKLSREVLHEQRVWRASAVDRVTIDRASSTSGVFRIGRTVYAPGCGLWLGVQWPSSVDSAANERLETLLTHLGDQGLGGERSVGYGQFRLAAASFALDLPGADGAHALTLSRYLPGPDELPTTLGAEAAYGLVGVVGWLNSPAGRARRRRSSRMLTEGSILHVGGRAGPWGRLVDVQPVGWEAHPVWRYGYACPVGVKLPPDSQRARGQEQEVSHA